MITTRFCPQCQQPLSVDAPAGLCPQCLMKAASGPPPTAAGDGLEAELIDIADPAEVAKKLPQFEILELLGRGGMGVVYKARQLNLDRIVALKILPPLDAQSPDFVARFTREARALAKLNHPNIVNVYDFGETGGLYYIIMEFVDGANLRQLFQTRKLTSAEALAIVPRVCDALQYAHEEGLVHRDIKPENLLIDRKGRVKIADFGLAKLLRREPLDMTLTLSGMALGTLRYMAPEQMDKPETVDHRADLYSLGVVIYEMLTGETPVGRFDLPSQKAQVDVRFDEIVLHALEREPARRYQHASEVRDDVEKVTSNLNVAQASPPVGPVGILPAVPGTAGGTPAGPTDWKSVPQPPAPQPAHKSAEGAPQPSQPAPVNHLNNFLGFFMTPQPGYAKQVGKPMLILTGVWMIAMLVITFSVPQGKQGVHLIAMLTGLIGVPLGLLILSLRWAVLRGKAVQPADKSATTAAPKPPRHLLSAFLVLLCLFGFFFGLSFQAKHSGNAAGLTKIITVGALDPLFTSESGPSGFQTGFNFFSWSFFAVVVAGIAFGALWRIGREDQGKVPRDPAWWRNWWKQVGVWGGLLLIVCIVRTVMDPAKVLRLPGDRSVSERFAPTSLVVRQDRSQIPAARTVGRKDYAWKFAAPPGHTLDVWMESWRDGKREIVGRFTFRAKPRLGDKLEAALWLQTMDGDVASVESKGQVRFDWGMSCGTKGGGERNGGWRPNIFEGCSSVGSNWGDPASATLHAQPGVIVTLLEVLGYSVGQLGGWSEESLQKGSPTAALLIRARLNAAEPGELSSEGYGALDNGARSIVPPLTPPNTPKLEIRKDTAAASATATPGQQDYAFKFSGPADHTLNVWMEVWQEGRMEWVSDFDFEAKPKAGEPLAASLTLTAMGGDAASKENKGKTRLGWSMNCGGSEGKTHTANALIADLSAGMGATYSTWDRQVKTLNPRPGETVTVLGITGYALSNFRSVAPTHTEADLLKRWPNAAVLIRARFNPARSGQLSDAVGLGTKVSDQAFERRTFAQFEISKQLGVDLSDCRTPAEAHAALVAAASTPDGRARAAQMVDEFGSDNISYVDQFRFAAEPMSAMWWKLRKKEPATAEEVVGLLENFITAVNGPGSHGVQWNHGEPIIKWAEGPLLKDDFAKKLKLTKLQIDEVNKLFKKYADEANALRRRHTKVTKNDQGHVLINIEPYSEECLELARKMVAELGGIVTQDIVPAVKVGALPMAIFGNAGECRETVELKKDSDGVYVIRIITSDWVPAIQWRGGNTTGWGSKDIDFAFGSYKMY